MTKKSVLYYLGAGASQQAIPVLGKWKESFEELLFYFAAIRPNLSGYGAMKKTLLEETLTVINSDLNFVVSGIENQHTVDTFAKKLYIMNRTSDLARLKRVISIFILYFQTIRSRHTEFNYHEGVPITVVGGKKNHNPRDMRYETFLSFLFDKDKIAIPEHVRVVSWNYDTQIEGAFKEYDSDFNIVATQVTRNEKQIFKVNGSVGTVFRANDSRPAITDDYKLQFTAGNFEELFLLEAYQNMISLNNEQIGIRYAWEAKDPVEIDNRIQSLQLAGVEVVVIIGYSFPFFNREIDSKILSALSAQRVDFYLQYPSHEEYLNVVDRLNGFGISGRPFLDSVAVGTRKNTFYISDLTTFYVPYGV